MLRIEARALFQDEVNFRGHGRPLASQLFRQGRADGQLKLRPRRKGRGRPGHRIPSLRGRQGCGGPPPQTLTVTAGFGQLGAKAWTHPFPAQLHQP